MAATFLLPFSSFLVCMFQELLHVESHIARVAVITLVVAISHQKWYVQLELSFHGVDASGAYMRREVPVVAAMLSLPLMRTADLLRRAKRGIPLVADPEPIQVECVALSTVCIIAS